MSELFHHGDLVQTPDGPAIVIARDDPGKVWVQRLGDGVHCWYDPKNLSRYVPSLVKGKARARHYSPQGIEIRTTASNSGCRIYPARDKDGHSVEFRRSGLRIERRAHGLHQRGKWSGWFIVDGSRMTVLSPSELRALADCIEGR